MYRLEDGGSIFLRNVVKHPHDDLPSQHYTPPLTITYTQNFTIIDDVIWCAEIFKFVEMFVAWKRIEKRLHC